MDGPTIEAEKRALRRMMRKLRAGRDPAEERAVAVRLARFVSDHTAETLALYAPHGGEPETRLAFDVARARGSVVLYPRVRDRQLELAEVLALTDLVVGYAGVLEPGPECVTHPPRAAALLCVPGLCFDRRGGRLGRGGGHYDRLLAEVRPDALRVGVCFEDQIVESVPRTGRDATMDVLVTPTETRPVR